MANSALSQPHFFLVPLLLLSIIPPTLQDVPLLSTLSTLDEKDSWVSPSGEFAFGFRPLPNNSSLFLLAIWFQTIPERTVVWSANRDNPVQKESRVELTENGHLVLYDHQGIGIWKKPNAVTEGATSASVLDTGNLVLLNMNSSPIWESFNEPTDTLLPRQILNMPTKLYSRRSEADYSRGQFLLHLQEDGNLVLYTVAPKSEVTYTAYWATKTVGSGLQVIFNESGHIYLTRTDGAPISITPEGAVSTQEFYHRATLDFDGVIRQYVYPKNYWSIAGWGDSWSVVMYLPPDNICLAILAWLGSGTCGFNSYCMLDDEQRTSCRCPPGYSYLDQSNTFGGCKQDFEPQSCESGGSIQSPQFELKEMRNVDWPLNDYEHYNSIDENQCRQECLVDCFCAVAVFIDGSCWKKKMPLSNGKMDFSVSRKTLIKVPKANFSLPPPTSSCKDKDRTTLILIGSVLFGGSGLLNILLVLAISLFSLFSYRRPKLREHRPRESMLGIRIHSFSFKELEQATNGFREKLDTGAFGTVYRGVLVLDSRHLVAVKMLDKVVAKGDSDKEFETEVAAIGQTHHKNLARLLGFCNEGPHRLLVYEFMSSGSLAGFLFGSMRPDWNQRMQIALGVARGLVYLHEECSKQVIHCDINPQNILLDECFTPRISGFGLAKLMSTDQTRSITGIRGTKGYVAPEWFRDMPITAKVDVYSFGVLLLEIICCRRNLEMDQENEDRVILSDWAYDCYAEMRLDKLVENDEEAMDDMKRVERTVMVAIWCIQENPTMRPCMVKVTEMLEGVVEVSKPPHPLSLSSFVSY
ncbi:hypothetical protein AAC387_Pa02g1154 [Persea americana]